MNTIIKAIRKMNNFTQQDLGEILNIDKKTISSYENGRTYPHINMIQDISRLMYVDINFTNGNIEYKKRKAKTFDEILLKKNKFSDYEFYYIEEDKYSLTKCYKKLIELGEKKGLDFSLFNLEHMLYLLRSCQWGMYHTASYSIITSSIIIRNTITDMYSIMFTGITEEGCMLYASMTLDEIITFYKYGFKHDPEKMEYGEAFHTYLHEYIKDNVHISSADSLDDDYIFYNICRNDNSLKESWHNYDSDEHLKKARKIRCYILDLTDFIIKLQNNHQNLTNKLEEAYNSIENEVSTFIHAEYISELNMIRTIQFKKSNNGPYIYFQYMNENFKLSTIPFGYKLIKELLNFDDFSIYHFIERAIKHGQYHEAPKDEVLFEHTLKTTPSALINKNTLKEKNSSFYNKLFS